jgi:hypothetical protein
VDKLLGNFAAAFQAAFLCIVAFLVFYIDIQAIRSFRNRAILSIGICENLRNLRIIFPLRNTPKG